MGFLKQMKDMKNMVAEAPELLAQTTTLAANASAMASAQQAAVEQVPASPGMAPPATAYDDSPIAGVTLELYVSIARAIADVGYDTGRAHELAATQGVSAAAWDSAVAGWNLRMQTEPAVAQEFNALYTGR